jgi:hypothetical protein
MVGKAALLLVMGFSLIFLTFGYRFNSVSTQTVQNYADYYNETAAHNLASSGANMAANQIFLDNSWTTGFSNLHLNGGVINVNVQVINVAQNIRKIVSAATFGQNTSTVEVTLAPSRFSQFAYYSQSEGSGIWWTGNDTVYGPFHTQGNLLADNHPVFGVTGYRTTIQGKIVYHDYYASYGINEPTQHSSSSQKNAYNQSISNDAPIFHGSFESGVDQPLPSNGLQPLKDAATSGGKLFNLQSTSTLRYSNFYMTFNADQITYRTVGQRKVSGSWVSFDSSHTVAASTLAPDGVIYLDGKNKDGVPLDINLKGTVKGQYSVVSGGNIYLDDDIVYNSNPKTNPSSTDVLGIIAQNNVYISDNNNTTDITIDAAIYCQDGGFGSYNYDTRSVDGNINLYGGITQNTRLAVGTYTTDHGNVVLHSGFNKRYRYDARLTTMSPPVFPTMGGFQIVSWKE